MKKILLLNFVGFLFINNLYAIDIKINMDEKMEYKDIIKHINNEALKVDSTTTKPIDQNYNDIKNNKYNNSNINVKDSKIEVKTPNKTKNPNIK